MTPKEKATDIFLKYYEMLPNSIYSDDATKSEAIQCALIVVEEILNNDGFTKFDIYLTEYWEEVKKELLNL
jgi:hypothetical protein